MDRLLVSVAWRSYRHKTFPLENFQELYKAVDIKQCNIGQQSCFSLIYCPYIKFNNFQPDWVGEELAKQGSNLLALSLSNVVRPGLCFECIDIAAKRVEGKRE